MTRFLLLVLAGCLAFAAAAIALMPAHVFHALVLQPRGVAAAHITGTIWDGEWHDVRLGAARLNHVRGALSARHLLTGQLKVDVSVSDPRGRAEGVILLAGQGVELRDVSGWVLPSGFIRGGGLGRAGLGEPVEFTGVQGVFGARGCESLTGAVRHDGFRVLDTQGAAALPVLEGSLECAGRYPALRFAGESDDVGIDGHIRLTNGRADWSLNAQPRTDVMAIALRAAGFAGRGDALRAEGRTGWD
ncbi:MAG: type 2a secretion system protein GspN [Oceanicaulis sp. HLUCCA04]|nr:MAG: type 2a secretion system protein GspN [Oceanicaulis sp. HLUCCA04]